MKLAEQLELDEKYEEAYAEYRKELVHKQNDIELVLLFTGTGTHSDIF